MGHAPPRVRRMTVDDALKLSAEMVGRDEKTLEDHERYVEKLLRTGKIPLVPPPNPHRAYEGMPLGKEWR